MAFERSDDENLDAFSVAVRQTSGPYQIVISTDGEVLYDSNSVTGNHSYQGHETEAGQDYAVTIRNLGETSLRGRILITAYYW